MRHRAQVNELDLKLEAAEATATPTAGTKVMEPAVGKTLVNESGADGGDDAKPRGTALGNPSETSSALA